MQMASEGEAEGIRVWAVPGGGLEEGGAVRDCVIAFPCSIGDIVTVRGEDGWQVVGLCQSDRGQTVMVQKGIDQKIAPVEAVGEDDA